jgi:hypothetical protein
MRIVFTCEKSITGGLNRLNLQVYGLSESSRLSIVKDAEQRKRIPIVLRCGYQGNVETIFQGTIHKSSNDREGADFISTIEALDGGEDYLSGWTSQTVRTKQQAVDAVLAALPNTQRGKLTQLKEITRPKVLVGNPLKVLPSLLQPGETFYIDNEQLFIVKQGEVVQSFVPLVAARTGLLNTPQRESQKLTFETLMNPALKLGARCDVQSVNAPYLNGVLKIESMSYTGDSDGQDWKQTVTGISAQGATVI